MDLLPKDLPILGICWGMQFLNVYFGGDLVQHLENFEEHYKKRRMTVLKDSMLYEAVGSTVLGNCYHHQGIDKIGEGCVVTALDDSCKIPHALENRSDGREIMSVIWHPESTCIDESGTTIQEGSLQICSYFIQKCIKYKFK
jgi:putative glutamine amidotransferase